MTSLQNFLIIFLCLNAPFFENFQAVFSHDISVDETMVPYYGRHICKQHIHGKPIRFGYKLWSARNPAGYLIQFISYQGSKSAQLPEQQSLVYGAAVVLQLLPSLPNPSSHTYCLFFDNFFTSFPLLDKLNEMGVFGTGTIRYNRTEKCPLEDEKSIKKRGRVAILMQATFDIAIVRWNDNSIVTMASNAYGVHPSTMVNRVASEDKKRMIVSVTCPKIVSMYKYIGGVDRFDENMDSERVSFRGKKWWFPLFDFGIDAACQNA